MSDEIDGLEKQAMNRDGDDVDAEMESESEDKVSADGESGESETPNPETSNDTPTESSVPTKLLARLPQAKSARDDEPYEFAHCTVLVMLQLMPLREGQSSDARKVFISARTHSHPPFVTQARWDELEPRLPNEIKTLLTRVKQELPHHDAERGAAEQVERERQAQIQAEREKLRAAKRDKSDASKTSEPKRGKKIDLNAPPKLSAVKANGENEMQVAADTPAVSETAPTLVPTPIAPASESVSEESKPQMTLF